MNNYMQQIFEILFIMYFIYIDILFCLYRIIIMHEALSLITKKLIAKKPPLFLPKLP